MLLLLLLVLLYANTLDSSLLDPETVFKHYVDKFNAHDRELYSQHIANKDSFAFLERNIPLFECPDKLMEQAYYFRWWTFRKHIKQIVPAPNSKSTFFVMTEFLPEVSWGGVFNTIACSAPHHFREGRWLHDQTFLDDYARFWLREGHVRQYSNWIAHSLHARAMVTGNTSLLIQLLPLLVANPPSTFLVPS